MAMLSLKPPEPPTASNVIGVALSLRQTGQKSINLERKCLLEYSSAMCCSQESGRETFWFWTLRRGGRGGRIGNPC